MKKLLFALLVIASALSLPSSSAAQSSESSREPVGIWMFHANFPGAPAPTYVGTAHFRADGTLSGPPLDQHTGPVLGEWVRNGPKQFAFTFVADTFDANGGYINTHRVRGTMTLNDNSLAASGETLLELIDTTGQVIFTAPAKTTFTGTRVVVLPLN